MKPSTPAEPASRNGDATPILTRAQTQAAILAEFEERRWRTGNGDHQLRLRSLFELEAVRAALAAVSERGRWIDPKERQPKKGDLFAVEWDSYTINHITAERFAVIDPEDWCDFDRVVRWMPLPLPAERKERS